MVILSFVIAPVYRMDGVKSIGLGKFFGESLMAVVNRAGPAARADLCGGREWTATVLIRVLNVKSVEHHFNACGPWVRIL